jgi:hypothetical protein
MIREEGIELSLVEEERSIEHLPELGVCLVNAVRLSSSPSPAYAVDRWSMWYTNSNAWKSLEPEKKTWT